MWNLEVKIAGVTSIACVHSPLNTTVSQFGLLPQNLPRVFLYKIANKDPLTLQVRIQEILNPEEDPCLTTRHTFLSLQPLEL